MSAISTSSRQGRQGRQGRHKVERRSAPRRSRRARLALAATGVLVCLATLGSTGSTRASYVDAENASSSFQAAMLQAITPSISTGPTSANLAWAASNAGSSPSYTLSRATDANGTGATGVSSGTTRTATDTGGVAASTQTTYVTDVAAGGSHACAIADGSLYCWGLNTNGQTGNGTTSSPVTSPALVSLSGTPQSVSAGNTHTCAIVSGAAYCWGDNTYGELGNGSTTSATNPVAVTGLSGKTVTAISAGNQFTCAIASGAAYCWGLNTNGQLGIGSTTQSSTPRAVSKLTTGVTSISAGSGSTACAVMTGLAYCWGLNTNGQLGDDTTSQRTSPVAVTLTGGSGVLAGHTAYAVSVGSSHSCVLSDGGVQCFGLGSSGQLGNGATGTTNDVPVTVTGSSSWSATSISAYGDHTCALTSAGASYCWGAGSSGQNGNGAATTPNATPVQVTATANTPERLSSGSAFTCSSGGGSLYCWGLNTSYQLGDGTMTQRNSPVAATSPTVTGCASGASLFSGATCSLAPSTAYWWQLGYTVGPWTAPNSAWTKATTTARPATTPTATTTARTAAVSWSAFTPAGQQPARYVLQRATDTGGSNLNTVATTSGLSATDAGPTAVTSSVPAFTRVSVGYGSACGIANGEAWCWGYNYYGQVGDGTTTDRTSPVRVLGMSGLTVTDIAVGGQDDAVDTACAIASGRLFCWGSNYDHEMGDPSTNPDSAVAVPVANLSGTVTALTVADWNVCAVADGTLYCWGTNTYGLLGTGGTADSYQPTAVSGISNVTAVSSGRNNTCALVSGGSVYCWGHNLYGESGNGTSGLADVNAPAAAVSGGAVPAGSTFTAVSTGNDFACAIAGGNAYCWGLNSSGQLGNGTTTSPATRPVKVALNAALAGQVTAITAGETQACAVAAGWTYCWGSGANGALGNGTTANKSTPVAVASSATSGALPASATNTAVATGHATTCAVANSLAYCWGYGSNGNLGNGGTADSSYPVNTALPATTSYCAAGATRLSPTTCSLAPATTYYYRVTYFLGSWTGPTSGWVPVTTSSG